MDNRESLWLLNTFSRIADSPSISPNLKFLKSKSGARRLRGRLEGRESNLDQVGLTLIVLAKMADIPALTPTVAGLDHSMSMGRCVLMQLWSMLVVQN